MNHARWMACVLYAATGLLLAVLLPPMPVWLLAAVMGTALLGFDRAGRLWRMEGD